LGDIAVISIFWAELLSLLTSFAPLLRETVGVGFLAAAVNKAAFANPPIK
jgi:hypothetical protein